MGTPCAGIVAPTSANPSNSPNGTAPVYPSSVTFVNGSATAHVTLYDAQSTTLQVTSGVSGTSTSFSVVAGTVAILTATSGANQSATDNTAFTSKLVATATDSYGNDVSGVAVTFAAPSSGAKRDVRCLHVQPAGVLVHRDHWHKRAGDILDVHGQRHQRRVQHRRISRAHLGLVRGNEHGQPDDHLHLDGAHQPPPWAGPPTRRRPLPPRA